MRCNIPEGVEVKLSAELIRPLVVGQRVVGLITHGRYETIEPEGMSSFLREAVNLFDNEPPCIVEEVQTKGKFMYWSFSNDWHMFCTFGMTGQWSQTIGKHPSLAIHFADSKAIYFNDPRHFGTIKFVRGKDKLDKKLTELGWDPLGDDGQDYLRTFRKVSCSGKPIGQLLMDQKLFAGVGNYIRAEALYAAEISPWRPSNIIEKDQLVRLFDALKTVMQESYQHQGATIHTYKTPYGEEGKYSSCFKVYDQKQDPLGNPIIREATPEGRTIHWCPSVQK